MSSKNQTDLPEASANGRQLSDEEDSGQDDVTPEDIERIDAATLRVAYLYRCLETPIPEKKLDLCLFEESESPEAFKVMTKLNELRQEAQFCDFVVKVGSQRFPVHKVVLCSQISYFYNMLTSQFAESKENEIEMKDFDSLIFEFIIRMVYSETISVNVEELMLLLRAADMLCFDRLQVYLQDYLFSHWSPEKIPIQILSQCSELVKDRISIVKIIDYFLGLSETIPKGALEMSEEFVKFVAKRFYECFTYFDVSEQVTTTSTKAALALLEWRRDKPISLSSISPFTDSLEHPSRFSEIPDPSHYRYKNFRLDTKMWILQSNSLFLKLGTPSRKVKTFDGFLFKVDNAIFNEDGTELYLHGGRKLCVINPLTWVVTSLPDPPLQVASVKTFQVTNDGVYLVGSNRQKSTDCKSKMTLYKYDRNKSKTSWINITSLPFDTAEISLARKGPILYILGIDNKVKNVVQGRWKSGSLYSLDVTGGVLVFVSLLDMPSASTIMRFEGSNLHVFQKVLDPRAWTFTRKSLNTETLNVVAHEINVVDSVITQLLHVHLNRRREWILSWDTTSFDPHVYFTCLTANQLGSLTSIPLCQVEANFVSVCDTFTGRPLIAFLHDNIS